MLEVKRGRCNFGFHSVGSRSDLASCSSEGILICGLDRLVDADGVRGGRTERAGEASSAKLDAVGETMTDDDMANGFTESLRRQL